ncbi:hypothetical protein [Streptomyces sp. B1I3]|uniref:hypothetical protein n=1 Tax=Streptomyces sp. B1I3 TaxID=3042264 RepID=UPI00277DFBC9|nr:hypothetical protein [Streptomyces sp. B1I3]MDQ0792837.1 hypothetical protein [Streptomyces sp. B1I3]
MDVNDPQQVGIAFAEIVLGVTVSDDPPDPSSALGRVRAFTEKYGEDALRPEHFTAAREGRPLLP